MVNERSGAAVEEVRSICERVLTSDETSVSESPPEHSKSLRVEILDEIAGLARGCLKGQLSRVLEAAKECHVQYRCIGRDGNDEHEKSCKCDMRYENA